MDKFLVNDKVLVNCDGIWWPGWVSESQKQKTITHTVSFFDEEEIIHVTSASKIKRINDLSEREFSEYIRKGEEKLKKTNRLRHLLVKFTSDVSLIEIKDFNSQDYSDELVQKIECKPYNKLFATDDDDDSLPPPQAEEREIKPIPPSSQTRMIDDDDPLPSSQTKVTEIKPISPSSQTSVIDDDPLPPSQEPIPPSSQTRMTYDDDPLPSSQVKPTQVKPIPPSSQTRMIADDDEEDDLLPPSQSNRREIKTIRPSSQTRLMDDEESLPPSQAKPTEVKPIPPSSQTWMIDDDDPLPPSQAKPTEVKPIPPSSQTWMIDDDDPLPPSQAKPTEVKPIPPSSQTCMIDDDDPLPPSQAKPTEVKPIPPSSQTCMIDDDDPLPPSQAKPTEVKPIPPSSQTSVVDHDEEDDPPPPTQAKRREVKAIPSSSQTWWIDDDQEDDPLPPSQAKRRAIKPIPPSSQTWMIDDYDPLPPTQAKQREIKAIPSSSQTWMIDDDQEDDPLPPSQAKRRVIKAIPSSSQTWMIDDDDEEDDLLPPPSQAKRRAIKPILPSSQTWMIDDDDPLLPPSQAKPTVVNPISPSSQTWMIDDYDPLPPTQAKRREIKAIPSSSQTSVIDHDEEDDPLPPSQAKRRAIKPIPPQAKRRAIKPIPPSSQTWMIDDDDPLPPSQAKPTEVNPISPSSQTWMIDDYDPLPPTQAKQREIKAIPSSSQTWMIDDDQEDDPLPPSQAKLTEIKAIPSSSQTWMIDDDQEDDPLPPSQAKLTEVKPIPPSSQTWWIDNDEEDDPLPPTQAKRREIKAIPSSSQTSVIDHDEEDDPLPPSQAKRRAIKPIPPQAKRRAIKPIPPSSQTWMIDDDDPLPPSQAKPTEVKPISPSSQTWWIDDYDPLPPTQAKRREIKPIPPQAKRRAIKPIPPSSQTWMIDDDDPLPPSQAKPTEVKPISPSSQTWMIDDYDPLPPTQAKRREIKAIPSSSQTSVIDHDEEDDPLPPSQAKRRAIKPIPPSSHTWMIDDDPLPPSQAKQREIKPVSPSSQNRQSSSLQSEILDDDKDSFISDETFDDSRDSDFVLNSNSESDSSDVVPIIDIGAFKTVKNDQNDKIFFIDMPLVYFRGIQRTKVGKNGQIKKSDRVFSNKHSCLYCGILVCKPVDHMERKHGDEKEIADLLELKPKKTDSSEVRKKKNSVRQKQLEILRNRGNHRHNMEVKHSGEGEIIPLRRPPGKGVFYLSRLGPCPNCYGWISDQSKHRYRCVAKGKDIESKSSLTVKSNLLMGLYETASTTLTKEVLQTMVVDDCSKVATSDPLIMELGDVWLRKSCKNKLRRANYTSTRMRAAARLLMECRKLDENKKTMIDFISPSSFETVIKATINVAGGEEYNLNKPSTALKIGHDLQRMANIKETKGIISKHEQHVLDAKNFNKLLKKNWNQRISSMASSTLNERRFNKIIELPSGHDLNLLSDHLKKELSTIEEIGDKTTFRRAVELVEARLLTFNKRRPGELEAMSVESYTGRRVDAALDDFKKDLTSFELELCKTYEVVNIRGKRGRKVPVLVPPECRNVMDMIVNEDVRELADVANSSFLFANFGKGAVRAYDALENVLSELKLENASFIKSTLLRKYIATTTQVLNISENQLGWITNHLGHNINIHKDYYRVMSSTIEKTKVAKLLLLADSGSITNYYGKTIDEIDFESSAGDFLVKDDEEQDIVDDEININDTLQPLEKRKSSSLEEVKRKKQKNEIIEGPTCSNDTQRNMLQISDNNDEIGSQPLEKRKSSSSPEVGGPTCSNDKQTNRLKTSDSNVWNKEKRGAYNEVFFKLVQLRGKMLKKEEIVSLKNKNPILKKMTYDKIKNKINADVQKIRRNKDKN